MSPTFPAQKAIAAFLDRETARIDTLIAKKERQIELLRERRAALIAAAVTGQLDLRDKPPAVTGQPAPAAWRVMIGAEIVHQHQGNWKFGRVKLQKELYLAEAHLGMSELQGKYRRAAAGPLDRASIEETERGLEAAGFYRASQAKGAGSPVAYIPLANAGRHKAELDALLGRRAEALADLIDLLRDLTTEDVEAVTTLYAVWNDALIDGSTPDDSTIVKGVLTEWHAEKSGKFTAPGLRHWLAWMKRHALIPRGQGPRTEPTMTPGVFR